MHRSRCRTIALLHNVAKDVAIHAILRALLGGGEVVLHHLLNTIMRDAAASIRDSKVKK